MHKYLTLVLLSTLMLYTQSFSTETPFSQEKATKLLYRLSVEIGPRPMGSPPERKAMEFALEKFREYGCDTAYIMPISKTTRVNTSSGIAIGVKRGATNRIIVLGGHIDSADPETPGADDDGSGIAVVLEASRILCSSPHQSTLVFCCFGGEEQGLEGSRYFADHFPAMNDVALMLQVDMANGIGTIDLAPETHGASAPRWLVRAAVEEFYTLGYQNLRYPAFFFSLNYATPSGSGSDHEPFLKYSIPAIDFSTDVSNPIHTARDNFENFDPRGLKRSGDVVLKLVERFDSGVPGKTTEEYFLFLLGQTPIFFPLWSLWGFIIITLILSIMTFLKLRRERERILTVGHWSFFKIVYLTLIIVMFGWLSSNLVGLFKGVRLPWLANPELFLLFALVGVMTGITVSAWLTNNFKITTCSYRLFRSSFIILMVWFALANLFSVKVALAPAFALLFVSLAMLVKNHALRIVFLALSPLWMMRLILSEWKELLFRQIGLSIPTGFMAGMVYNIGMLLLLSLSIIPFVFASAATLRNMPSVAKALRGFKSGWAVLIAITIYLTSAFLLTNVPSYNKLWYRPIDANIVANMDTKETSFTLKSPEYLDHVQITYDGKETRLTGKSTGGVLPLPSTFDSSLVHIQEVQSKTTRGDTTDVNIIMTIATKKQPYKINIGFSSALNDTIVSIQSSRLIASKKGVERIDFYSFPDTFLIVPIQFSVVGRDTIKEKISVIFSELPSGVKITGGLSYVIPRMEYVQERKYFR